MPGLCRDCLALVAETDAICSTCSGVRLVRHSNLFALTVAHIDCDAFYASVEKRDRPELRSRPVIVGGGVRGVVTAACYVARIYGVRSAMPMFKALRACPDAVVIKPDFRKYVAAGRAVRALMQRLTPLVQPLSIDEAVLDLAGTEALHGAPPAAVLAGFANDVEREVGVTVSVGLGANRLLAKIAVDLDKPRGFAVIGANDALSLLAGEPVGLLPGVGPALARRLAAKGITRLGQLQALDDRAARALLGEDGPSLSRRARGIDDRLVDPARATRSVSAETTFDRDLRRPEDLEAPLWRLAEKLARRLREQDFAAAGVVLKLKTVDFRVRTRATRLAAPSLLPDSIFAAARSMLLREATGPAFRLIGVGASPLALARDADPADLADPDSLRRRARQQAIDALRARLATLSSDAAGDCDSPRLIPGQRGFHESVASRSPSLCIAVNRVGSLAELPVSALHYGDVMGSRRRGLALVLAVGIAGTLSTTRPAAAQDAAAIQAIQTQIKELQVQLRKLQAQSAQRDAELRKAKQDAADARASAVQAQDQAHQAEKAAAAAPPAPAAAALPPGALPVYVPNYDPTKPNGTFNLGGVTVTLGGFVDLIGYYRSINENRGPLTSYNTIPFAGPTPQGDTGELGLSAQATRVSLKAAANIDDTSHIVGYGEIDFLNGAGNSNSV